MKTGYFPLPVGNIDHLSCLKKRERPYESRLRHQYHIWGTVSTCFKNRELNEGRGSEDTPAVRRAGSERRLDSVENFHA